MILTFEQTKNSMPYIICFSLVYNCNDFIRFVPFQCHSSLSTAMLHKYFVVSYASLFL
ncbi:hypothetical protein JHK82_045950 [Glycine max]|uniref:Uncharacterized protein n=2 Tax=Glycine subgen. Soja TaxID=1462606 RepID=K7MF07_SOYBN|nr:hypothetical protein JHK86_044280 [Glycine max]KAG4940242.1 hypothetical protein JHK87_044113 [Glycine soja]KAG4951008.1 hypothetical protein JHK85_044875 [Glycine max]KAG5100898.1 hypothetical protein JHK82_045950 [Glycine max]KAH1149784.1 hypothetical protein GYH30_044016 [Glycine max]